MTTRTRRNNPVQEFRRIVVALDESPESQAALETAAHLAALLGREILGVFVEDENLLNLSGLPLASEYRWGSRAGSSVTADMMQAALRVQAERARQRLLEAARRARVASKFEVSRGRIPDELRNRTQEKDLLILGRTGRSPRLRNRLGSTASSLCRGSFYALMLVHSTPKKIPLLILYQTEDQRKQAIELAERVRIAEGLPISLVQPVPSTSSDRSDASTPGPPSLAALRSLLADRGGIVISQFPRELCEYPALEQFLQETEAQVILLKDRPRD